MAAATLLSKFFDLLIITITARIISPAEFGLITIALSTLYIIVSASELPIFDALVQRKEITQEDANCAFTISLLRSIFLSITLIFATKPLALFFNQAELIPILLCLSVVPIGQGLISPGMLKHLRELDYERTAKSQFFGKCFGFATTLIGYSISKSYWPLIIGAVSAPIATALGTYILAPWNPKLTLKGTKKIIKFAGWITAAKALSTINQQGDRVFIAKIVGSGNLGRYAMGNDIASTLTYTIANPVAQPLFSSFSRINNDRALLTDAYLRGQQIVVAIILPIGVGLALLSKPAVTLFLGRNWSGVSEIIAWLAPITALQMIAVPSQAVVMAAGFPRLVAVREFFYLLIRLPLTIAGALAFGIMGAVIARVFSGVVLILLNLTIASKFIDSSPLSQVRNCARSLTSTAVMCLTVTFTNEALVLDQESATLIELVTSISIQASIGAATYILTHIAIWHFSNRPKGIETWLLTKLSTRR